MSLRSKILAILSVVVVLYAAVDNGTLRLFAARFFGSWEESESVENIERVRLALDEEIRGIEDLGRVWASWDAVFRFVTDPESPEAQEFPEHNLGDRALDAAGLDVLFLCDRQGLVTWSSIRDPETRAEIRIPRELPSGALSVSHPLRNVRHGEDSVAGLMMTEHMPLLVAAVPIRDATGAALHDEGSRFRQALHGFVVVGRFLDSQLRTKIGSPASIEVDVWRVPFDGEVDAALWERVARLTTVGGERDVTYVGADDRLHVLTSLNDLRTQEPLVLEGVADREITALGKKAVDYALFSTLASALLILFVLLQLLQRIVLKPLSRLTSKAVEIGRTDDTTIRTGLERDDELGQLSEEFDGMLEKLADSRAQVVRTARQAGMSEIATGVLHNVGNVLNSVNVSTSLVMRHAEQLSLPDLERMVNVLRDNQDDLGRFVSEDPRGKHLLPFLFELTGTLVGQKKEIVGELRSLATGIEHISDLVRSQQTYAGAKGVFEYASLQDEVDAAIRICEQALDTLAEVEIVREYADLPSFKVDKHKLMEVLVNLIQNAHHAMKDSGGSMRLTLRLIALDDSTVRIEVEDNGVGIASENLDRIFHHGFTTRPNGHGFGLHVSANAATEMNASLQVRSDGPGRGATFYLDLPLLGSQLTPAA